MFFGAAFSFIMVVLMTRWWCHKAFFDGSFDLVFIGAFVDEGDVSGTNCEGTAAAVGGGRGRDEVEDSGGVEEEGKEVGV